MLLNCLSISYFLCFEFSKRQRYTFLVFLNASAFKYLPEERVEGFGFDEDLVVGYGVVEIEPAGVQADGGVEFGAFGTVLDIPFDRMPDVRELRADLVVTASMQFHLQKRIPFRMR